MTTSVSTRHERRTPALLGLVGFLVAVAVVAVVGGLAAGSAGSTYQALELPPFAPPSWLFGPVWTVLYVMIAASGWLVWRAVGWGLASTLWVVQLGLNLAWTPLFFGAGQYGWALVDIVALVVAVGATIVLSARVSRVAAWLLVPYLGWVCFATALNAAIWWLN
jgi:tryptophan-rich sensory protein